ncbi:MAG: gliding motility protein GldC [Flavobacteriales bacterium]
MSQNEQNYNPEDVAKTSEINFKVKLDENHIPLDVEWDTSDDQGGGVCKIAFLTLWDRNEENTMRIDLWTKDVRMDEMKRFFYENLLTMTDSLERATDDKESVKKIRDFANDIGKDLEVLPNDENENGQGEN